MINHKSYMDIVTFATKFSDGFSKGDKIVIQEKIDGANASFQYDSTDGTFVSFSRKQTLNFMNTLRGFKTFVDQLDTSIFKQFPDYRFYGEWLVAHTVNYPNDKYQRFYLFDIYDTINEKWLSFDKIKEINNNTKLEMVPIFYEGEFIDWNHINSFIGKSNMGIELGEGIIVKNMSKLNDPNNRMPFYIKLVASSFQEVHRTHVKIPLSIDEIERRESELALTKSIVTEARIRKIINKLIDSNIIQYDWDLKDMSKISKILPRLVYDDCVKEENETVMEIGSLFGKRCASISLNISRNLAANR